MKSIKMHSKYREVPRMNNSNQSRGARTNHTHPYHGVSTGARGTRDAENARMDTITSPKGPSNCALFAVGALYLGVVFDATAWGTTAWGYAEEETYYTRVGLWQICNVSLEPQPEDSLGGLTEGSSREHPVQRCVFPTSVPHDWIHKSLVMEIMGGFCALGLFISLSIFVGSLKFTFVHHRTMMIVLIPLAFLAALMNFIGALTITLNLSTIKCRPSYSVALDFLGMLCFSIGGLCALMDIQGCFDKKEEELPQPPMKPRPSVFYANS